MPDWSQCPAVERSADRVSGAWVFRGTRVPIQALFENLESGARLDDFLEWFPGVTREQAEALLEHAAVAPRLALKGPNLGSRVLRRPVGRPPTPHPP
jgi:uncharacterized protein (DUF433 family)